MNMINDDAVALCERLNKFWYEKGVNTQANKGPSDLDKFKHGSVLFITCQMANSGSLRDMEDDFGFLPYPKFDAEQKEYRTLVHDTAQLSCVPVSSDSIDISGAVLEALSAESYRTLLTNNSTDYVSAVQKLLAAGETKLAEQIKAFRGE